jgi:uncharacterized phage protein gp47/JayE
MVEIKSLKTYADQILTDIEGKTNQTTPAVDVAYNRIIANALAAQVLTGMLHNIDQRKECFPQTASEDVGLPLFADLVDRQRKTGTAAAHQITVVGTEDYVIPSGASGPVFKADSGKLYTVTTGGRIQSGTASIAIACTESGSDGTLAIGDTLSLISTNANLNDTATVTAVNITGADEESVDDWRAAIVQKIAFPPDIGTAAWFYYQALTIDGITRAYPYSDQSYPGRVIIYLVADDNTNGAPSAAQIAAVEQIFTTANKNILWAYDTLPNNSKKLEAFASPIEEYDLAISDGTPALSANMKSLINTAIENYANTRNPTITGLFTSDTGILRTVELQSVIENVIQSNTSLTGNFAGATLSLDSVVQEYFILPAGTRPKINVTYN